MIRPRSLAQFIAEFPDEPACAEYMIRHRWPDGFVCDRCGSNRSASLKSRAFTFECLDCGRQVSITAGTIMHRTKLPLTTWFWAAHLVATHSNGISALQLMSQIGVTERTAWLLLQKIRAAMIDRDKKPLRGLVEVDQTEVPFRTSNAAIGPPGGKIKIIGAVEVLDRNTGQMPKLDPNKTYLNTMPGRARLAMLADEKTESIHAFVRANVAPGSALLTDGHRSYLGLNEGADPAQRYILDQRVVGKMAAHLVLPWVHRVFSLMKRWGLGTLHGFRLRHIDKYLEEFCFRFNRRQWRKVSFDRIVELLVDHAPHDYATVVGRKPRPNRKKPPVRLAPRHRKTALGMRQDRPKKPPESGQARLPSSRQSDPDLE